MIVKFKLIFLAAAALVLLLGVVLSAIGETRRRPGLLRTAGLMLAGVGLGSLVALSLAS